MNTNLTNQQIILQRAKELFMRFGIKNMTMDDIARELGMSKKTIYLYVYNKSDLVVKALRHHIQAETQVLQQAVSNNANAIEELLTLIHFINTHFREFDSRVYHELQKYYADAFTEYSEYRDKTILNYFMENIRKGINQGVYRADLEAEVISRFYVYGSDVLLNQQLFPSKKFPFIEVYRQVVEYHLRGIVSKKGLEVLENNKFLKTLES
ncbi:MAG: TetR/AcrR family transcriptional regulator [Chitinophagales bacterium]